jgi:hypothetical protein
MNSQPCLYEQQYYLSCDAGDAEGLKDVGDWHDLLLHGMTCFTASPICWVQLNKGTAPLKSTYKLDSQLVPGKFDRWADWLSDKQG